MTWSLAELALSKELFCPKANKDLMILVESIKEARTKKAMQGTQVIKTNKCTTLY